MLTLDQLRQRVPAIFAETPANHVSADYRFMPTVDFLEAFMGAGWYVQEANTIRPSKKDPRFCKHTITMQHTDFQLDKPHLGMVVPNITIVNSHDWSSLMSIFLGMFRQVCTNGLMVSFGSFIGLRVRHDSDVDLTVSDITSKFRSESVNLISTVERWRNLTLTVPQQLELATAGGKIRWGDDEFTGNPAALNAPRRSFDFGDDLWTTFNRIQENIMKGGAVFNGRRAARTVRNIDAIQKHNTQLWDSAMQLENEITLSLK